MDQTTGIANFFHFTQPPIYGVTEDQLQLLERSGGKLWKDFFLMFFPLSLGIILTGYSITGNPFSDELAKSTLKNQIIVIYGLGIIFLILAIICGIGWFCKGGEFKATLRRIRTQPRYRMDLTSDAGGNAQIFTLTPQPPQSSP